MTTAKLLTETKEGSSTTNVFNVEDLFYMPLKAVIDANTQASLSAIQIIKKYGFENDKSSGNYGQLKMVSFSYNYVGKNGQLTTMSVSIPFITLIPLPLLEVKHADVEIAVKILAKLDINIESEDFRENRSQILTILSPVKEISVSQASMEANMNVKLRIGQSELPGGILKLLNLGQEASIGDHLVTPAVEPEWLGFTTEDTEQTLRITCGDSRKLPENLLFTILVEPAIPRDKAPFTSPIRIQKGWQYGEATWKKVEVIPIREGEKRVVEISFSAGSKPNNGFITISSNYTNQRNIYFNIP